MLNPQYNISNRMLWLVSEASQTAAIVEYLLNRGWKMDSLVKKVAEKKIYSAVKVENSQIRLDDVEKVLLKRPERNEDVGVLAEDFEKKGGGRREVQLIINYANALRYVDDLVNEKLKRRRGTYEREWLLEIHALVTEKILQPHEVGVLRKNQVVVRGVDGGEIVFRPPNVVEVEYQLEDLFYYLNQFRQMMVHPLVAAGVAYYELMRIHPFVEANGMVTRLWMRLMLMREGVDVLGMLNFEKSYEEKIENYYEVLVKTSERGEDLSEWLMFWLEEVGGGLREVRGMFEGEMVGGKLPSADQVPLTERQIRIIDFMRGKERVEIWELRDVLTEVSDDTILRDLKDLQKKGVVEKKGRTKGVHYILLE